MKWKNKKEPQIGDTKVVKSFAWMPTLVGESWVWLEFYYTKWEWREKVIDIGWIEVESRQVKVGKKTAEPWHWIK